MVASLLRGSVAALSLTAALSAQAAVLNHHFTFENGLVDSLNATVVGTAHGNANTLTGTLNLDGSGDYVEFATALVPHTGSYSVAVSARGNGQQVGYTELISQGTSFGPGFYLGTDWNGVSMRATDVWINTGVLFGPPNVWNHYALVVDAAVGVSRLYVNGSLMASIPAAIVTSPVGTPTRFGAQFGAPASEFFNGRLDDVRIYSGALTASEVAALAATVPAPSQQVWQLHSGPTPPANGLAASAFDPVRGAGVLFGGTPYGLYSTPANETWVWNGQWQRVFPVTTPPARHGAGMTYDAGRGVIVMFGGATPSQQLNDTWTWDGTNWTQIQPANAPSPRSRMAFAYDPQSQKCLLFSGYNMWTPLTDTWEWDGANWSQLAPATTPGWRCDAQLTYNGNRLTLTGGRNLQGSYSDVWEWTGSNWLVTDCCVLRCGCGTGSGGRTQHTAFFDSTIGCLVLMGGKSNFAGLYNSTMEYDGVAWRTVTMPSPPQGRFWQTSFYDSWRGVGVMHGGFGSVTPDYSQPFAETWTYSGPSAASVAGYTTGCPGPTGVPALTVLQRPILGQTYQLGLSGLSPNCFPWMISGWSMTNLNLNLVMPQAQPGCLLGASVDAFDLMLGGGPYSLPIPNAANLLGLALHHQLAQFEFDAGNNWVGLSVSGALRATLGNP